MKHLLVQKIKRKYCSDIFIILHCLAGIVKFTRAETTVLAYTFTAPVSGGEVNFLITEVTSARLTIHVDMDCCCNRPGEVCVGCGTSELCVKEFPVHRPEGDLVPHRPVDAQHVEGVVDQSTASRPRHSGGRNSWNNTHCQILDSGTTTLLYCSHNS